MRKYSKKRAHLRIEIAGMFASAVLLWALLMASSPVPTRAAKQEPQGEVVANLAAGHVLFCVTKTAIIVAATQETVEKGSREPAVLAVSNRRIGVLLGAVEWNTTAKGAKAVRLDAELPTVAANATRRTGDKTIDRSQPSDIEEIGVGMLETLRPLVDQIHHKLDLKPDESLTELLLADYVEDYGPEIWRLDFRVKQEDLGNDYWNTRVLRPAYTQLYPPEKGQPRTFVEVQYPQTLSQPGLLERLVRHDPSVENMRNASPEFTKATTLVVTGLSEKADAMPIVDFMRAAMPVVSGSNGPLVMALLDGNRGFQWVLAPQEKLPAPTETKPEEPGAPSLRRYNPSP